MIGTWSVFGPQSAGSVVQLMNVLEVWSVQKTLSGWVQFFVLVDCSVGIPMGSIISME